MTNEIGIQELIKQLRSELLEETQEKPELFFIEGLEVELHVAIKREGQAGIKIGVLQFGGLESGVSGGHEQGHKVTLKLRPLIKFEEARETLNPEEIQRARGPFMKGE
jgi:hypothetical protein